MNTPDLPDLSRGGGASPCDALAQRMWCGGSIVIQVFSNFECKLKIHSCTNICYFEEITSKIGIRTAEL